MSKRGVFIIGIILFLTGCVSSLYLAFMIAHARIEGIFNTMTTDSPTNRFENFRCPLLVSTNETVSVVVILANPIADSLDYTIRIGTDGFVTRSQEKELRVTVPGGQATELTWTITPVKHGNQAIAVQAVSSRDSALPGPFHTWPTSFGEGCGILVIDSAWTGTQVLLATLSSLVIGVSLAFPWLRVRIRVWKK